jgi:hypothetical protein
MKQQFDLVTADFAYVRWLGDRKRIEKQTTTWDRTIIDRTSDLKNWVEVFSWGRVHRRASVASFWAKAWPQRALAPAS